MLEKTVSRDDPQPLYKQVKDRLMEALALGDMPPQGKLASERELVARYGVSRITIRQAMKELVNEGHLRSHPGKGFYATGRSKAVFEIELLRSFTATALEHGRRPGSRLLRVAAEPATAAIAAPLGLAAGADVVVLKRLRLLDDHPVAISFDWIALGLVPDFLSLDWGTGNRSLYAELMQRYGLNPLRGQTILTARLAEPEEIRLLA